MRSIFITSLIFSLFSITSVAQINQSYILARTQGVLPFIEYGPGDDRLGGAKMTYMDTGVMVKVIDSLGTDYIIQLSNNLQGFIAKGSLRFEPNQTYKKYYLSGNWKTFSDGRFDYINISMPEKLPYRSFMQVNPNRLVIDLFGITSNTNWITQVGQHDEIRNTWYEQLEDGVMRVYVDLKSKMHWGHTIYYDTTSNRLAIRIKHAPPKNIKQLFVAVDAGHGGENSGAAGETSKRLEKDLTLVYAKTLEKELKKAGIKKVYMTRLKDTTLSMPERINALKDTVPDLLISIHFNSSSVDTVHGTSTFYRYIGFRPLTQTILKQMKSIGLDEFGNVGSFNFALSGPTDFPNCLVEVAFLSNLKDEKFILNKKSPEKVSKAILAGIKNWMKEYF